MTTTPGGLDSTTVLARAAAWVWVPEGALVAHSDEYLVVGYGDWFADPTQAFRLDSERSAADLVEEVLGVAAGWGRPSVTFSGLHDGTRPDDLENHLRDRGAELVEEYAVAALDLSRGLPDLDVPSGIEVREVVDLASRRDLDRVDVAVFGGEPLDDEGLLAGLERERASDLVAPRWVAYLGGDPVGAAGCTLVGEPRVDTVRLWGGGVLERHRGRGVYRALLDRRLRVAADAGAGLALVKGRLETSAPVLRRAGFTEHGRERSWRLGVPAGLPPTPE